MVDSTTVRSGGDAVTLIGRNVAWSYGARAVAAFALLAVLAPLALLAGCGSTDGASAAGSPSGPGAFADESYAELATDGQAALWMAV